MLGTWLPELIITHTIEVGAQGQCLVCLMDDPSLFKIDAMIAGFKLRLA